MSNFVKIKKKINRFNKILSIDGDKSLSIRWALLASQSFQKSKELSKIYRFENLDPRSGSERAGYAMADPKENLSNQVLIRVCSADPFL